MSTAIELVVPKIGESVQEARVVAWLEDEGSFVALDAPLVELESEKASLTVASPAAGILHILVPAGTDVAIGAVLAHLNPAEGASSTAETGVTTAPSFPPPPISKTGLPSPAARLILEEAGIPSSSVSGSGRDGRITKADALAAKEAGTGAEVPRSNSRESLTQPGPTPQHQAAPTPPPSEEEGTRRERMSMTRKTIARRMIEAKQSMALLTTFNEVDMSAVKALRARYGEEFAKRHGVKLGLMGFFVKAVAEALAEYPILNASLEGEDIVYHTSCHLGLAVATPRGLVVPVLRQAERKTLAEIEKGIRDFAERGSLGTLGLEELTGGTFTISNGGGFGSMLSTPIVNPPQAAVLGLHNIVDRAVVLDGQLAIRPIMYLALSYDHRLIDGADSVRFLVRIKELVENPARLLLQA